MGTRASPNPSKPFGADARVVGLETREQRRDAGILLASPLESPVHDVFCDEAETLPRMTQRVERTRLDERLDRPLVEHDGVDAPAEVVEVGERPVCLALDDDALDETLTDVSDRRESEDDPTSALPNPSRG